MTGEGELGANYGLIYGVTLRPRESFCGVSGEPRANFGEGGASNSPCVRFLRIAAMSNVMAADYSNSISAGFSD